uniref:Toxin candidate TRINITY_DN23930_c0_g1_i1.p1 n=1 Tax=Pachycerianthus borealis TaxID=2736680 RepID=A0A7G7WYU7_9CNID|nr:toxin candidate TRINITY_DN23930_c0_g1_i1.p1 [Pachycerianthus borealis]
MLMFLSVSLLLLAQYSESTTTYKGCFHDKRDNRVFETLLFADRNSIPWGMWETYSCDLIQRCASAAIEAGFDTFGLEFYGECWSGNTDYTSSEDSTHCVTEKWHDPGVCYVGGIWSLAVYTVVKECNEGWSLYDGNCYKQNPDCATFQLAEDYCVSQGGHLASIHSEEENQFVASFPLSTNELMWIGFNDLDEENTFVWTDGTDTDYTKWYTGEPNNVLDLQHCVVLIKFLENKWGDIKCTECKVSVCKRPL